MSQRCMPNKRSKRCDVTYISLLQSLWRLPYQQVNLKGKEHNVLPNNLIDIVNSSKPIKKGDKVKMLMSKQENKACDVTYINFVVCNLGLASQEVTFCQIQPMKTCKTSMAMIRRLGHTFLSKHKLKSARRLLIRVSSKIARVRR